MYIQVEIIQRESFVCMAEVISKWANNMLVPGLRQQGETVLERKDRKSRKTFFFFSISSRVNKSVFVIYFEGSE